MLLWGVPPNAIDVCIRPVTNPNAWEACYSIINPDTNVIVDLPQVFVGLTPNYDPQTWWKVKLNTDATYTPEVELGCFDANGGGCDTTIYHRW